MGTLVGWMATAWVVYTIYKAFEPTKLPKEDPLMLNPTTPMPEDITYAQLENAIDELQDLIEDLSLSKNSKAGKKLLGRLEQMQELLDSMPNPEDREKFFFSHDGEKFVVGFNPKKGVKRYEVYNTAGEYVAHSYKTRDKAIGSARWTIKRQKAEEAKQQTSRKRTRRAS